VLGYCATDAGLRGRLRLCSIGGASRRRGAKRGWRRAPLADWIVRALRSRVQIWGRVQLLRAQNGQGVTMAVTSPPLCIWYLSYVLCLLVVERRAGKGNINLSIVTLREPDDSLVDNRGH
jgi:hypothetical protein